MEDGDEIGIAEDSDAGRELGRAITLELAKIPLDRWKWWAPLRIAVWRFVHSRRPDVLGELIAEVSDDSVDLRGTGSEWFSALERDGSYLACIDRLSRQVLEGLPEAALERGFVRAAELPTPDPHLVEDLNETIEAALPADSRLRGSLG